MQTVPVAAGRIGPMELKNRVIRSATNEHLSQPDGQLTTAWMDTLVELAENEVGLVITGHMSVDRQQRSDQGQTVLDEQTDLGLLYETARRSIKQEGGSWPSSTTAEKKRRKT